MPQTPEAHREYMRAYRARKKAERSGAKSTLTPLAAAARPARPSREHRDAVSRMLRATGLLHIPEEAPLVALVKSLAKELDEGAEGAVASRYRAALADVRKVLAYSARPKSSADPKPPAEEAAPAPTPTEQPAGRVNSLAAFREAHGIG